MTSTTPALAPWRAATLTAYVIGGVLASTWGPRLPDLTRELHVSTSGIGAILAAANVGLLLGLVAASPVARAAGVRRAVGVALAAIVVGLGVAAASIALSSIPLFLAALLVLGAAAGVLDVLINVEGSGIEQRTGRSFLPLLHALWLVGAAVGAGIGAACAALRIGTAWQSAGLAGLIAVAGVLVVRALPAGERDAAAPSSELPRSARVRDWLRGWADPRLVALGVLIFGVELAEGSARTWMPLAIERDHGQSDAVSALFVTVFSITTAGFRAAGGPIVDRLGRVRVVRATIAVGIVGVALFILGGSIPLVLAGTVLWAIGNCVAGPLAMSAAAEGGGDAAARVGVVSTIGFAAGLAGPPVIGLLAQQVDLAQSFWVLVVAFAAAFVLTGALRRRAAPVVDG